MDEGILLVDGTLDGLAASPFPTDEDVDEYYADLLTGYSYTNWDIAMQGSPPLTEIAKYSTIIWHTDDISNYPFVDGVYKMKCYLLAGGNLFASCWKQLCGVSENFQNYFLYLDESYTHNQADFTGAFGMNGFPDIAVDLEKILLPTWGNNLQYVNKFLPIEDAEAIFTYDSFTNDPDWENAVCGQRFSGDYKTYILGFPLYFMMQEQSEDIVQNILEDFGEESSIESYELEVISCKLSNYPNPFNPTTTISFELNTENTEDTELIIYNLKGQKIREFSIFNDQSSIEWNGTDDNNQPVASGIYFYKLRSGEIEISRKMLLLK